MIIGIEKIKNRLIKCKLIKYLRRRNNATGMFGDVLEINKTYDRLVKYVDFKDKNILELGPGQSYQLAEKLKCNGAKTVDMMDIDRYFTDDFIISKGMHFKKYDGRGFPFPDHSFDMVYSNNVYEHLRFEEITVSETFRVLKPGGISIHQIDLRDHFCFDENNRLVFNMMKYTKETWWSMTSNRVSFVNRLRISDWIVLHEKNGFTVSILEKMGSRIIGDLYHAKSLKIDYLHALSYEDATTTQILLKATKNG